MSTARGPWLGRRRSDVRDFSLPEPTTLIVEHDFPRPVQQPLSLGLPAPVNNERAWLMADLVSAVVLVALVALIVTGVL
jgi:hypothetical protein